VRKIRVFGFKAQRCVRCGGNNRGAMIVFLGSGLRGSFGDRDRVVGDAAFVVLCGAVVVT